MMILDFLLFCVSEYSSNPFINYDFTGDRHSQGFCECMTGPEVTSVEVRSQLVRMIPALL